MIRVALRAAVLPAMVLISGASAASIAVRSPPGCSGAGMAVDGEFDQAGFSACSVDGDGTIDLHIRPETEPINPSPWYAARLTQAAPASRRVRLNYVGAGHRYQPWFSRDGRHWQRLTVATPTDAAERVAVDLPVFAGRAFVAAQPLVPLADVMDRWSRLVADGRVEALAGGTSVNGRTVPLYRIGPANAPRLHVIAARQHPPETTGAGAFDAFSAFVIDWVSRRSCPSDAIVFAPIVNPDGIARGHWRTNAGLIDLNRDWGRFTQPETRALGSVMHDLARSSTIVSVFDFHSTRMGAIYVSRSADARTAAFAADVARQTGLAVIETRSAGAETLKSWSENRFGSESFTVELADSASPQEAATVGTAIAERFVRHYVCADNGVSP